MKEPLNFKDEKFVSILEAMKTFSESYAKSTGTFFCVDEDITKSVVIGLAKNKLEHGSPLCPCRCYSNKDEEASFSYWNCPCVPMRERKECHCMLFLTEENQFSSKSQNLDSNFENLKNIKN
jgi:ferredoxin-thioredoxin reductase catalytic chain